MDTFTVSDAVVRVICDPAPEADPDTVFVKLHLCILHTYHRCHLYDESLFQIQSVAINSKRSKSMNTSSHWNKKSLP